ncbi:MAG: hypothetical protein A2W19_03595 [Spirochaetes bacterium RBG_16_49_21]|nr:MAG: hypothetical protein A2W19_03595 [Spirochaetes bacterium RBG_16_49_21]
MKFNITEYEGLINGFYKKMRESEEPLSSIRLSEDTWSLKEMVGHLVDSASNNHQRFVRLHLDQSLEFPAYDTEKWKQVQKMNDFDWHVLIELWKYYNDFLLHIIRNINEDILNHYWIKDGEQLTLEHLVKDYYKHIQWHIDLFDRRLQELKNRSA